MMLQSKFSNVFCCLGLASLLFMTSVSNSSNFSDLFQPYWAADHMVGFDAGPLKLTLDNSSGCGFGSKKKYLFGQTSMLIKFIGGDSAGTVIAFYMSSDGPNHNELDFEFLGNVTGEPYLVQTNVYVDGTGDREQRHSLWFDPAAGFHEYSIFWNRYHIRFMVDGIPIRVFTNKEGNGIPYPKDQAMGIYASVWNADDWATQGGRVKTDWSHAPFVTSFQSFQVDACELEPPAEDAAAAPATPAVQQCTASEGVFWWDAPDMAGLTRQQRRQLRWVQRKHLVYDYCKDTARFTEMPGECMS